MIDNIPIWLRQVNQNTPTINPKIEIITLDDLIDKEVTVADETFNAGTRGAFAGGAPTPAETFSTGEEMKLDTQNTSYLYDDFPQFSIQQNTPQYQILPQQNYLTQQYELEEL